MVSGDEQIPLAQRRCVPCEGGVPPLGPLAIERLLPSVPAWRLVPGPRLARTFEFADFAELMRFVNRMAAVAEEQGHHPDFTVQWARLDVDIWTHAITGLSENDFILAARIDALESQPQT